MFLVLHILVFLNIFSLVGLLVATVVLINAQTKKNF